jgi:hypothetical protein
MRKLGLNNLSNILEQKGEPRIAHLPKALPRLPISIREKLYKVEQQ